MMDKTFRTAPGRPRRIMAAALLCLGLAACGTTPRNDTFDLSLTAAADGPAARNRQILVAEPTALKALDSEQIVVRVSPSEIQYLSRAQWGDRLPRMVQSKLVEAFESTGRLGGVGRPGQGLAIDYQVVTDIRAFEITSAGPRQAVVEISVTILNDRNGTVRAQRSFRASQPVSGSENRQFVTALDRAFATVSTEIVDWTLRSL